MTGRSILTALAIATAGLAQSLEFVTSYVQLDGRKVGEVVAEDFDGDGARDLIVATQGDDFRTRRIEIWIRRPGTPAFGAEPDRALDVPADVVAFTVADVHSARGRELVLLSATLAVGLRWEADAPRPKAFRIGAIELLWQPPNLPHTYLVNGAVADVDRDGLDDLLIPQRGGYVALVQRRDGDGDSRFDSHVLAIPELPPDLAAASQARLRSQGDSIRLRLREQERHQLETVVELDDRLPVPALLDHDGDGDLDVVALVDGRLCVWPWNAGFTSAPATTFELPENGASLLNPSRSAQLADMDGDGRADLVSVSGRVQGDDVQSFVEVFLQKADGSYAEKPADRLLLRGFVDVPRLDDIDGDGRPELVIGSLRTDVIGALASGGSSSIDAQLNVFGNRFEGPRGRFARPVALAERIKLPSDITKGRFRERMLATFFADLDGDGLRDFLQRTDADTLQIRLTRRADAGYSLGSPAWSSKVDPNARILPFHEPGKLRLLIVEDRQIILAEQR